jgi:hypothetical protein
MANLNSLVLFAHYPLGGSLSLYLHVISRFMNIFFLYPLAGVEQMRMQNTYCSNIAIFALEIVSLKAPHDYLQSPKTRA